VAEGWDFRSIATSVLPAVIGGLAGARRGSIGAIPGALYGASTGARYSLDAEMQRELANRQIAEQNARIQQNQQRIELDARQQQAQEERFAAERQRWALQDRVAEQEMKARELEMKRNQMLIDESMRSQTARETIRQGMKDDEERALFDADPRSWLERKDQEIRLQGAGNVLAQFGLANGGELARILGPQGTSSLLGSLVESRNRPRDRFGFHYDSTSGMGFTYDKVNGTVSPQQIGAPRVPVEKRTEIENQLLKRWKEMNPPLAKLGEESGDWSAYDQWRASPSGRVEAAYLGGEIDFETAQGYRESMARQEQQVQTDALDTMRTAYLGAGKIQTEQGFQKYLQTPEGKQNLEAYKKYVREKGRPKPTQQVPGLGTVRFDQSISPAERKEIEKRLGATSTPTQSPTAPQTGAKKRPTLDEIFGG